MRMPRFTQSIRFRLTVLYSLLLFALAGTAMVVTYVAVERTTDPKPITKRYQAELIKRKADGRELTVGTIEVAAVEEVESEVNLRTLETMRNYSGLALGGLFLASLGIGWVLSGRALRPVGRIARTAREIQATDLSQRIRLGGYRDELRDLADTIDSMLGRLDSAFNAQRQLIDDASHELRTPLAIIRANLDATLAVPGTAADERDRAVAVIDRATARMSRLVEDLLATARRESEGFVDAAVDLAAVAREAGEEFEAVTAERGVRIAYTLRDGLTASGDHEALRRGVANLLSNAARLAPPGTEVTVGAGAVDGWLWLAVADRGPGIATDDQGRVFDRFWRREAGTAGPPGERRTGLGLAIVRQIVESHGGRAAVHSREGDGATFVLWLPAADRTGDQSPPVTNPLRRDVSA
jgi:signal transduction histidine kinase